MNQGSNDSHRQYQQSLGEQVNNIEQEARMVLPGIQALFGFQLIVVFNSSFKFDITATERYIHLTSILFVVISTILVVAPAAYHRQANHHVSKHFVDMSGNFLSVALIPLAIGTCLDIYLITRMISESYLVAHLVAWFIFLLYVSIWFIYPRARARRISNLPALPLDKEKSH